MGVIVNIIAAFMEAAVKKKRTKFVHLRFAPEMKQKIRELADREYRTFIQQAMYLAHMGLMLCEAQPSAMEYLTSKVSPDSESRKSKSGRLLRLVSKKTVKEG